MTEQELWEAFQELIKEEEHLIRFTDRGWTVAHPIRERLEGTLFDCRVCWDNDYDPGVRGTYRLFSDGSLGGIE